MVVSLKIFYGTVMSWQCQAMAGITVLPTALGGPAGDHCAHFYSAASLKYYVPDTWKNHQITLSWLLALSCMKSEYQVRMSYRKKS